MTATLRKNLLSLCILAFGSAVGCDGITLRLPLRLPSPGGAGLRVTGDHRAEGSGGQGATVADLQKGDPGGTLTGTVADVTMTDAKAGPTLADAGNQIGQNKVAINFVWTLICGFLVMFMQAGFRHGESGSRG